jgi:Ca-activated chloride channel family protein
MVRLLSSWKRLGWGLLPVVAAVVGVFLLVLPARPQEKKEIRLLFTYGSEKDKWLKDVTKQFHEQKVKTSAGNVIVVDLEPMGSGQCIDTLLDGTRRPHLTSPASQVWINVANGRASQGAGPKTNGPLIESKGRLVRSPVVLAMWEEMVKAAGWEDKEVGWNHLADLIEELGKEGKGWGALGKKEWGAFKFAHTHPQLSNSGLLGVLAMAYARADSSRPLTAADLKKEEVRSLMAEIQSSVLFYGESTGFLGNSMLARGPEKISAAVLYENEVIRINKAKAWPQRVLALYPSEGTFWCDHPAGLVHADWVTAEHQEAAQKYYDFLMAEPQQHQALAHGFRPGPGDAKTDAALGEPFTAKYGVNPAEPHKVLTHPNREAVEAVLQLWRNEQKGCRVVLAIDISFSMKSFKKLDRARTAAIELVQGLSDSSRLTLIAFNHEVKVLLREAPLDAKGKEEVIRRLNDLQAKGGTHLYDAVVEACDMLQVSPGSTNGSGAKSAMEAVILLSDGQDRDSKTSRASMEERLKAGEGSVPIFYTIAYGATDDDKDDPDPPDRKLLEQIASQSGGRAYAARPDNIDKALDDISGFFGARPRQGKK